MKGGLVTLGEVKGSLAIHFNDTDPKLSMIIGSATNTILRFLKSDGAEYQDTSGEFVPGQVPDDIKYATILMIQYLHDQPELDLDAIYDLPPAIVSLIIDRRPLTLA